MEFSSNSVSEVYVLCKNYNDGTKMETEKLFLALVCFVLVEAATVHLFSSNDNTYEDLLSEF